MPSLSIGDLCQIAPYDPEHFNIGARVVGQDDSFVWIPKGSHVFITQIFEDAMGEFRFCSAMYDGLHVEICCDVLGVES